MASAVAWSHDFCLHCDKQTMDGEAFCSQSCRLAELEGGWASATTSPAAYPSSSRRAPSPWSGTSQARPIGLRLPASTPFPVYKSAPTSPISYTIPPPPQPSKPTQPSYYFPHAAPRTLVATEPSSAIPLSPSSSRSSLSSMTGHAPNQSRQGLSEETRLALQSYVSSFDHSRNKRRTSLC